jgi:hypothetical protein
MLTSALNQPSRRPGRHRDDRNAHAGQLAVWRERDDPSASGRQRSVTDIPDPSLPRFCTFPGCVVLGQPVTACRRGYGLGCFFRRGVGGLDGIFAGPEGIDLSE